MNHQLPEEERAEVNTRLSAFLETKQKESGMTAEEFAASLGLSRQTIAAFKKSRSFPSVETILTIKKKFPDLSLDEIMTGEPPYDAIPEKKSEVAVYTPAIHRDSEVARLSKELERAQLQLKHTGDMLKKEEKHNQNLAMLLENFQGVTNDTTGNMFFSGIMADYYDYTPKKYSDREVSLMWAKVMLDKRN